MHTIYINCRQCVIWMGEINSGVALDAANAGFQLLRYMAAAHQADDPESVPLPPAVLKNADAALAALKGIENDENQWWHRIWTLQEAALPRNRSFQWGPLTLPWDVLDQASMTWIHHQPRRFMKLLASRNHGALSGLAVHAVWIRIAAWRSEEPFVMIHRWRNRLASDPRDKIYGLLGLCQPGRLPVTMKCDYSLSTAQVFRTLTLELILDTKGLQPLTCNPRLEAFQATPGMPSWALDLAGGLPKYGLDLYYHIWGYPAYQADRGLDLLDLNAIKEQLTRDTLSLTGVYVDTVVRVEDGYKTGRIWEKNFSEAERLLRVWHAAAMQCDNDAKSRYAGALYDRDEAFARLMIGDVVRNFNHNVLQEADAEAVRDLRILLNSPRLYGDDTLRLTVYSAVANQSMIMTERGLLGFGHLDVQTGDEVWVFRGGNVPFLVRPRKGEGESGYTFVNQCYVQGVMQGEAASGTIFGEKPTEQTICLH